MAASSAKTAGAPAILPRVDVPTYSKDVAPIVQKNCQVCHRPGEVAPPGTIFWRGDEYTGVKGSSPRPMPGPPSRLLPDIKWAVKKVTPPILVDLARYLIRNPKV